MDRQALRSAHTSFVSFSIINLFIHALRRVLMTWLFTWPSSSIYDSVFEGRPRSPPTSLTTHFSFIILFCHSFFASHRSFRHAQTSRAHLLHSHRNVHLSIMKGKLSVQNRTWTVCIVVRLVYIFFIICLRLRFYSKLYIPGTPSGPGTAFCLRNLDTVAFSSSCDTGGIHVHTKFNSRE